MTKAIKRTNKATLIAAALIITGATAVFGTYAAEDQQVPTDENRRPSIHQELTDEQKAVLEEAKELFEAGDKEGGKAILDAAGIKPPRRNQKRKEFMENLTEEQKEAMKEAKVLFEAGDKEGGKAILDAAGIKPPKKPGHQGQKNCPRPEQPEQNEVE